MEMAIKNRSRDGRLGPKVSWHDIYIKVSKFLTIKLNDWKVELDTRHISYAAAGEDRVRSPEPPWLPSSGLPSFVARKVGS